MENLHFTLPINQMLNSVLLLAILTEGKKIEKTSFTDCLTSHKTALHTKLSMFHDDIFPP